MILLHTITTATFNEGVFGTPVLQTPGMLAVGSMEMLTTLVCLLLMIYTVESLRREQGTGLAAIHYATPTRTSALLFGKAIANSLVGLVIVLANLVACLIVLAVQGKVRIDLWPFALVWGLLLLPTFLLWTSFITACFSLTNNREATCGLGLARDCHRLHAAAHHSHELGRQLAPVGRRSLERHGHPRIDRTALILNRVMALGLSVFFIVLAVDWFRRCDVDPGRVWTRLYPKALLMRALAVSPYAVVPLVAGIMLGYEVGHGFEGGTAKKDHKDYWRKNLATWKDVPVPALAAVDLNLDLYPQHHSFHSQGAFEFENHQTTPLRRIPLTGGDHWSNVSWTMNDQDYAPDQSLISLHLHAAKGTGTRRESQNRLLV